ncbi:MAG: hypothetical protein HRU13_12220, partial [Phycisphaerales bacterium]|nr:hypothetical protein [Phycisphaerales bacterium]
MSRFGAGQGSSFGAGGLIFERPRRGGVRQDNIGRRVNVRQPRIAVPEADNTGVVTAAALQQVAGATASVAESIEVGRQRRFEERNAELLRRRRELEAEQGRSEAEASSRTAATVGRVLPEVRANFQQIEDDLARGAITRNEGEGDVEFADRLLTEQTQGIDEDAATQIADALRPRLIETVTNIRLRQDQADRQEAVNTQAAAVPFLYSNGGNAAIEAAYESAQEID